MSIYFFAKLLTSTRIPGPIVEEIATFFIVVPLEACGFALIIVSVIASKFSISLSLSNDTLPIGTCTFPALSTRYSTLPALISLTAFSTSK